MRVSAWVSADPLKVNPTMHRLPLLLATLTAAAIGVLIGAFPAVAAPTPPTTGPATAACAEANVRVEQAATAATTAADALDTAQTDLDTALQAAVEQAETKAAAALDAWQANPSQDTLDALTAAQRDLITAVTVLRNAAAPSTETDNLTAAQTALQAAVDTRTTACTSTAPTPAPGPTDELDCADFVHDGILDQAAAQAILDRTPDADPHGLDGNHNRIACEGAGDTGRQVTVVPTGPAETGGR